MSNIQERVDILSKEIKILSEYLKENFLSLNKRQLGKYQVILANLRYLEESVREMKDLIKPS